MESDQDNSAGSRLDVIPASTPLAAAANSEQGAETVLTGEEQAFCRRFSWLALLLAIPVVVFFEFIIVRFVMNIITLLRSHG